MKKCLGFVAAIAIVACAYGIDKEKISNHLMKALSLDTSVKIELGEPVKSVLPGLKKVPVKIGNAERMIYVTNNGKHYVWGDIFDTSVDPDQERAALIGLNNVHAKGNPAAPVTVVEFTDLQCPYCERAHAAMKESLYKEYTQDQVRWVYKHFPLENHQWAEPAAVAAECAGGQNKEMFWEMAEKFFKNASSVTPENVSVNAKKYAKELKLDETTFQTCLAEPAMLDRVRADKNEGMKAGVSSTPTIFINGRMMRGFRNFESIKRIIDEKLGG